MEILNIFWCNVEEGSQRVRKSELRSKFIMWHLFTHLLIISPGGSQGHSLHQGLVLWYTYHEGDPSVVEEPMVANNCRPGITLVLLPSKWVSWIHESDRMPRWQKPNIRHLIIRGVVVTIMDSRAEALIRMIWPAQSSLALANWSQHP